MDYSISRQAAIDALYDEFSYAYCDNCDKRGDEDRCGDDCHRRFINWAVSKTAIERVLNKLPAIQPEHRWIPCSETLPPDEKGVYWICTDTEYQCECRWTNVNPIWTNLTTEWHWNIFDLPQYSRVLAWMPLPEPYKEEG